MSDSPTYKAVLLFDKYRFLLYNKKTNPDKKDVCLEQSYYFWRGGVSSLKPVEYWLCVATRTPPTPAGLAVGGKIFPLLGGVWMDHQECWLFRQAVHHLHKITSEI